MTFEERVSPILDRILDAIGDATNVDALAVLGMAINLVIFQSPREVRNQLIDSWVSTLRGAATVADDLEKRSMT